MTVLTGSKNFDMVFQVLSSWVFHVILIYWHNGAGNTLVQQWLNKDISTFFFLNNFEVICKINFRKITPQSTCSNCEAIPFNIKTCFKQNHLLSLMLMQFSWILVFGRFRLTCTMNTLFIYITTNKQKIKSYSLG